MPTRFYFPSDTAAPISPVASGTWQNTTNALERKLTASKTGTAMANGTQRSWTAGQSALDRTYVSDPIKGVSFTGMTVKCQLRTREFAGTDNTTSRIEVYVITSANTWRGQVLNLGNAGPTTEYVNSATLRNKTFADGDASGSFTAQDGDRIVVKIGHSDASGTTPEGQCRFGDTGSTDLAENETETTDNVPWIEFSGTIQMLNTGTSAPTVPAFSGAATAQETMTGTAPGQVPAFSGAATAQETMTGTAPGQVPAFGGAASGDVSASDATGTAHGTVPAFGGAAQGTENIPGSGAGQVPAFGGAAQAVETMAGSVVGAVPAFGGAAQGTETMVATAPGQVPAFGGAAQGTENIPGSGAGQVPAFGGAATGAEHMVATAAGQVPSFSGAATGVEQLQGAAAGQVAAFTGAAQGTTASPITGVAAGDVPAFGGAAQGNQQQGTDGQFTITLSDAPAVIDPPDAQHVVLGPAAIELANAPAPVAPPDGQHVLVAFTVDLS